MHDGGMNFQPSDSCTRFGTKINQSVASFHIISPHKFIAEHTLRKATTTKFCHKYHSICSERILQKRGKCRRDLRVKVLPQIQSVSNPWSVWALIAVSASAAQTLQFTKIGEILSAPLLAIIFGLGLAAIGLLPQECQIFDMISSYILPLAASLYLLESDLGELATTAQETVIAFFLATFGTILGTIIAWVLTGNLLGADGWKVVSALAASYIGGSINFAAVSSALNLLPGNLLASAMSADMIAMAGYLAIISAWPIPQDELEGSPTESRSISPNTGVSATSLSSGLAAASIACGFGTILASKLNLETFGLGIIAIMASALASLGKFAQRKIKQSSQSDGTGTETPFRGAESLGGALMSFFFVTIGAAAGSFSSIFKSGWLLLFIAIQLCCHLAFTMGIGKLMKLPTQALLTASNAAVGGPGTAAAMASSKGWSNMVRPALLIGAFGYSIGTPIGILIGQSLQ